MSRTQPNLCLRCNYDLYGNTSGKCPECGLGATAIVGVHDPRQFHMAHAALERDGLLVRAMAPDVSELGWINTNATSSISGWFWVDATQLERVEACLDEAGVATWIGNLPIVDRSEPKCPKCDFELDPQGPEVCAVCGTAFQWVDIEMPEVDPTGVHCKSCGYDLTGNTSGRCPECGAMAPEPTLERIVDAATRAAGLHHDTVRDQKPREPTFDARLFRMVAALILAATVLPLLLLNLARANQKIDASNALTLGVIVLVLMVISLIWAYVRAWSTSKNDDEQLQP